MMKPLIRMLVCVLAHASCGDPKPSNHDANGTTSDATSDTSDTSDAMLDAGVDSAPGCAVGLPGPPLVAAGGKAVASADFDGNGKPDFVVASAQSAIGTAIGILRNEGRGAFTVQTYPTAGFPSSVAVGDLDGNGAPDLAIVNNGLSIMLNDGTGLFQTPMHTDPQAEHRAVAIGDLDGDGKLDLALANGNDNTVSVLLGNGDGTFVPQTTYATGMIPVAVAIGDVDASGKLDLVVANSGSNSVSVFLNNGNGTFSSQISYASGTGTRSVAIGNLDSDGMADLVVASAAVTVLLSAGGGTFATAVPYSLGAATCPDCSVPTGALTASISDFDGDGNADVAALTSANTIRLLRGSSNGALTAPVTLTTNQSFAFEAALAARDIDADGKPDLMVMGHTTEVFVNRGDGTFHIPTRYATGAQARSVALGDLDGDTKLDVATANSVDNTLSVLLNEGNGTLAAQTVHAAGPAPNSVAIGKLDGDTSLDVVVANGTNDTVSVFLNSGNGTLTAQATFPAGNEPRAVAVGDFDSDSKSDIAVVSGLDNTVGVLRGNGDGTFAAPTTFGVGANPAALAIADFNADGKPDLAVANYNAGSVSVLLNAGAGSFATQVPYATGGPAMSIATGDLNSDGKLDLAIAYQGNGSTTTGGISVLLGNGSGTFTAGMQVEFLGSAGGPGLALTDLDDDDKLDLVTGDPFFVLRGHGDGAFFAPVRYPGVGVALVAGDIDGDGRTDFAGAALDHVAILRSRCIP